MSDSETAIAGLTLVSLVIGAALTVLLDVFRGQLERKQRREDRRNDFQRENLIDLQDAIDRLATRTGEMKLALDKGDPSPELVESQRQAEARVILLKERITDDTARADVQSYLEQSRIVVMPGATKQERARALNDSMTPFNAANERIGGLMRSL